MRDVRGMKWSPAVARALAGNTSLRLAGIFVEDSRSDFALDERDEARRVDERALIRLGPETPKLPGWLEESSRRHGHSG